MLQLCNCLDSQQFLYVSLHLTVQSVAALCSQWAFPHTNGYLLLVLSSYYVSNFLLMKLIA